METRGDEVVDLNNKNGYRIFGGIAMSQGQLETMLEIFLKSFLSHFRVIQFAKM